LRGQRKRKWGPDMTEWTLSGVENQDLKGWYPRATIESSIKPREAEIGCRGAGVHGQPEG